MTKWFEGARADSLGLMIAGGPHRRGADFLLSPDGVHVSHGEASATLEWSSYAPNRRFGLADSWSLSFWGGGPQGIGIDGPMTLDPVRAATSSILVRLGGWNPYNHFVNEHPVLPLWAIEHEPVWVLWQKREMEALVQLLVDRSELRPLLLDPPRMGQLAGDLSRQPHSTGGGFAVTPSAGAVTRALDSLGYRFRYGRPLPGDVLDPLEVVLEKVMAQVAGNAWGNVQVSVDRATAVINMHYCDVGPWPFGALGV